MKDYSLTIEERREFILNYLVKDDKIIIAYASDEDIIIPYTKENEKKVLEKMKHQVLKAYPQIEGYKINRVLSKELLTSFFGIDIILTSFFGILSASTGENMLAEVWPFLAVVGTPIVPIGIINICSNGIIKDIEKNKLYLDNEKLISEYYDKIRNNYNYLQSLSQKGIKVIEERDRLTLKEMDLLNLKDLKTLIANIKRMKEFDLNLGSEEKTKPITRTREKDK